ncbi:hypothetical protein CASFOL_040504 [Castilleja foliolosa]|uniref:Amino acid transporter transmembrane domain-containing protein n=1 Tax=Castilleja foliolosa TaxID=1961234 RepID=A0ABD3BBT3_9LAMI
MGVTSDSDTSPLLTSPIVHHSSIKRTGTIWTAVAHIITGVIGSGVLALSWSLAQLGWVAGPFSMILFAAITLTSTILIADCYRYPDPEHGPIRNPSYTDAVRLFLGEKSAWICGVLMHISYYGTAIAYIITSAKCLGIPDFHSIGWLSVVSAIMSFSYSSIGLGLGVAKVIGSGVIEGSTSGISTSTKTQKVLLISQALGDIAFAYPYSIIALNIQDTLKSPPPESKTMNRASIVSICITTFFYLSCGGFGYAAFGDQTPGNILTGFGFYEPYWLIDFANACVVLHLVGGYQIYAQPVFATVDKWSAEKFQDSSIINKHYILKLPFLPAWNLNPQRLCFRTAYVASTTAIAMIFPYFNQMLGVSGALTFWPLAIYFPVEMWFRQKNIEAWTGKWIALRVFTIVCFVIAMFALVGSIEGLVAARFR